jgi:hypothetical protein
LIGAVIMSTRAAGNTSKGKVQSCYMIFDETVAGLSPTTFLPQTNSLKVHETDLFDSYFGRWEH